MGRNEAVKRERYRLIDSLRGFALLNMVAFHLCYDIFMIYGVDDNWAFRPESVAWERFICVSFILISGISLNFSKHAYRRGLIVSGCGALITLVTAIAMPDEIILFGVLSCIGACMLIAQALRRLLEKCNPFAGAAAAFALFGFSYGLPDGFLGFFNTKLAVLPEELYRRGFLFLGLFSAVSVDLFVCVRFLFMAGAHRIEARQAFCARRARARLSRKIFPLDLYDSPAGSDGRLRPDFRRDVRYLWNRM